MTVKDTPSLEKANSAAARARLIRSDMLMSMSTGLVTIHDAIEIMSGKGERPLARITIRQALIAQGTTVNEANRILDRIRSTLDVETSSRSMTLGWLCDPRAGGRRYLAFLEATCPNRTERPWPGFPSTAYPRRSVNG